MKTPIEKMIDRRPEPPPGTNLDIAPDDVCQLVQLAREFHAQDAVVLPEEPELPPEDLADSALAGFADDPVLMQFRSIIADLDRGQQVQIVALMWMGRGDYEADEWDTVVQDASDEWTDYTADYLLAHPLVADHLTEGLEMLGYSCE